LIVRSIPPVGGLLPVQIAVGPISRRVSLDEQGKVKVVEKSFSLNAEGIRAETTSGASVGVLTPDQAIEAAGSAQAILNALSRVDMVHIPGYEEEPGRAMWALQGCFLPYTLGGPSGRPDPILDVTWLLLACPTIAAATTAKSIAVASSSSMQVSDLVISGGPIGGPETPVVQRRGYIFLPPGNYKAIEVPVEVEDESGGGTEIIVQAWDSAADLEDATVLNPPSTVNPTRQRSRATGSQ
jgi:hypothetical protein